MKVDADPFEDFVVGSVQGRRGDQDAFGDGELERFGHDRRRLQRCAAPPPTAVVVGLMGPDLTVWAEWSVRRGFQARPGTLLPGSGHAEIWYQTGKTVLTRARFRSPLGRCTYDLPHARASGG